MYCKWIGKWIVNWLWMGCKWVGKRNVNWMQMDCNWGGELIVNGVANELWMYCKWVVNGLVTVLQMDTSTAACVLEMHPMRTRFKSKVWNPGKREMSEFHIPYIFLRSLKWVEILKWVTPINTARLVCRRGRGFWSLVFCGTWYREPPDDTGALARPIDLPQH